MENQDSLYWEDICRLYPNSWVLTGISTEETQKDWKTRQYKILYQNNDKAVFDEVSLEIIQTCREQKLYAGYFDSYTSGLGQSTKRTGLLKKVPHHD